MGLFDNDSGGYWGNPNSMAWLGMAQALGQAAMPSRMPVPNGAVFGALAGGLMQGAKSGYDMRKEQMQSLLYEAQAAEAKRKADMMPQLMKMYQAIGSRFAGNPGDGTTTLPAPAQYAPSDTTDPGIVPAVYGGRGPRGPSGSGDAVDQFLDMTEQHESGGRNIRQQVLGPNGGFNPSTGTVTGPSSAQGYFQIIDPTWRSFASRAGVDVTQYPNAMSAPYEVQRQVARTIATTDGVQHWTDFNKNLRAAAQGAGLPVAGPIAGSSVPAAPGRLAENVLPAVPNFAGLMAGNRGASYAPEALAADASDQPPVAGTLTKSPTDPTPMHYERLPGGGWKIVEGVAPPVAASVVRAPAPAMGAVPPQLGAILANASRPAPVNNIRPLASGAVPAAAVPPVAAPLSLAPNMPLAPAARSPIMSREALELALAGGLSQLAGVGDIFKPLETAYYNSPQQKAEVAGAVARSTKLNELPFIGPGEDAKRRAAEQYDNRAALLKADLDARNAAAKAALDLANADLLAGRQPGPDGRMIARPGQADVDAAQKGKEAQAATEAAASMKPTTIIQKLPDGSMLKRQVTEKQYADMVAGGAAAAAPGAGLVPGGAAPGAPIYGEPYSTDTEIAFGKGIAGVATKRLEEGMMLAEGAVGGIKSTSEARRLIEGGVITGAGAEFQLNLARVLNLFGADNTEKIKNTEAFLASRGQAVIAVAKAFGTGSGFSSTDREYVERMTAGKTALNKASILEILDINERADRWAIQKHNDRVKQIDPKLSQYSLIVEEPPGRMTQPLKPMDRETMNNARAAIATKGRDAVIEHLLKNRFDPGSL